MPFWGKLDKSRVETNYDGDSMLEMTLSANYSRAKEASYVANAIAVDEV